MVTSQTVLLSSVARYREYCADGLCQGPNGFTGEARAQNAGNGLVKLLLPTINRAAYDVASDLTYDVTTFERESLKGQTGVQGYSEMPKPGAMSFTLRDAGSLSVTSILAMTSSEIQAELANGKYVLGSGMWCVKCEEVKSADGTFVVSFEGTDVSEITTSAS